MAETSGCPACSASDLPPEKVTLFNKLGGHAAVKAAVDIFYVRMLADPRVSTFFEGIDMKKQRAKQAQFMTYVFGAPEGYKGKDLRTAHKRLIEEKGLNEGHFDIVAEHLAETLRSLNIPEELVNEVMTVVATTKPIIYGKIE